MAAGYCVATGLDSNEEGAYLFGMAAPVAARRAVGEQAMKKTNRTGKRPIDQKRDSGGAFTLGSPGETAIGTFVLDGRLIAIMTRGVYAVRMADSVDPDRTDIDLPNTITQQVLSYGSDSPFISRTLLTGRELFQRSYLGADFNEQRAFRIMFEAAQHLAAMTDLKVALDKDLDRAAQEFHGKPVGISLALPVTPNLRSRGEAFIRHADLTCQATKALCDLFFSRKRSNDSWARNIIESLRLSLSSNQQSEQFLVQAVERVEAMRHFRNASEHPDATKEVKFWDYEIRPGLKVMRPSLEIIHPKIAVSRTELSNFMAGGIEECGRLFEAMAALLCNESIKVPGPLCCQVV